MPWLLWLLAQSTAPAPPELRDLWGLGAIAVAMVVGAGLTYRYVVVPERTRGDAAQARADRSFELCLPVLERTAATEDKLLSLLPAIEAALREDRRDERPEKPVRPERRR